MSFQLAAPTSAGLLALRDSLSHDAVRFHALATGLDLTLSVAVVLDASLHTNFGPDCQSGESLSFAASVPWRSCSTL